MVAIRAGGQEVGFQNKWNLFNRLQKNSNGLMGVAIIKMNKYSLQLHVFLRKIYQSGYILLPDCGEYINAGILNYSLCSISRNSLNDIIAMWGKKAL